MDSMNQAAAALNDYVAMARAGKKVFYGPFYSFWNLAGAADATGLLPAGTDIEFFQTPIGQVGNGFARTLRLSETNLEGSAGSLPAGYSFAGETLGVYMPPQLPIHLKDHLTRHAALKNERLSHSWKCGKLDLWPCGEFGHVSKSVATTIANQQIQYGVNGSVGARRLPPGAQLFFPSNEVISFKIEIYESVFVTTDGLAINPEGTNALTDAIVGVVMEGWRYENLNA